MPPEASRVVAAGGTPDLRSPSRELEDGSYKARKKRLKGWDGEVSGPNPAFAHSSFSDGEERVVQHFCSYADNISDSSFASLRTIETTCNPDGSATCHVVVRCTLEDIAKATNLRAEDAAFALNECGLLLRRASGGESHQDVIAVSREMVETVARERKVKPMCILALNHVML
jgi:hypothetical protein